jgi:hypothetical protein
MQENSCLKLPQISKSTLVLKKWTTFKYGLHFDHHISPSQSKCWYSNKCLHFLKRAVPLRYPVQNVHWKLIKPCGCLQCYPLWHLVSLVFPNYRSRNKKLPFVVLKPVSAWRLRPVSSAGKSPSSGQGPSVAGLLQLPVPPSVSLASAACLNYNNLFSRKLSLKVGNCNKF